MSGALRDALILALTAVGSGGLGALVQAWLAYQRRRPDAPEGARVIVEGAGAAVITLQAVLATMHTELAERDQRIEHLEARLATKDKELIALRLRVAGLETELHAYKGAHP